MIAFPRSFCWIFYRMSTISYHFQPLNTLLNHILSTRHKKHQRHGCLCRNVSTRSRYFMAGTTKCARDPIPSTIAAEVNGVQVGTSQYPAQLLPSLTHSVGCVEQGSISRCMNNFPKCKSARGSWQQQPAVPSISASHCWPHSLLISGSHTIPIRHGSGTTEKQPFTTHSSPRLNRL